MRQGTVMQLLRELSSRMDGMEEAIVQSRETDNHERPEAGQEEEESALGAVGGAEPVENSEPSTLRKDIQLMARAARCLADIESDEGDEEDTDGLSRTCSRGKIKSGSAMVASDVVKKRIDWPHLHVTRLCGGRRRNVTYSELRLDEFALGFLTMIQKPGNNMNVTLMIRILQMVLQDSMDFSWSNALSFYQMIGLDVEKGYMKWEDADTIRDMRISFFRATYTEKKEPKENGNPSRRRHRLG